MEKSNLWPTCWDLCISLVAGRVLYYPITPAPTSLFSNTPLFSIPPTLPSFLPLKTLALLLIKRLCSSISIPWWDQTQQWKVKAAESFLRRCWAHWHFGVKFPLSALCWFQTGWNSSRNAESLPSETEQPPSRSDMQIWTCGVHHSLITKEWQGGDSSYSLCQSVLERNRSWCLEFPGQRLQPARFYHRNNPTTRNWFMSNKQDPQVI